MITFHYVDHDGDEISVVSVGRSTVVIHIRNLKSGRLQSVVLEHPQIQALVDALSERLK